jgi:CheY-like chemotaxis protein
MSDSGSDSGYHGEIMNRTTISLVACTLLLLLLALPASSASSARKINLEALNEERQDKQKRIFLRPLTQKRIASANELMDAEQNNAALEKLGRLNPARLNPKERAAVYRLMARASVGLEDAPRAIKYLNLVVDQEVLLVDDEASVRYQIVQLFAGLEQWAEVDEGLTEWFRYVEKPNGRAYYLLAISRYQRDLFADALVPALEALETTAEPKEGWLKLTAALHLVNGDFDSAVPILEKLVVRFTKKQYWVQLSLIYGARGDYPNALRVQQLAYIQHLLTTDDELRRLARSLLFRELPSSGTSGETSRGRQTLSPPRAGASPT